MAAQTEPAAAGPAPARRVGDLHVSDDAGVRGDRGVQVVAVAGQVIEVAEEVHVGGARRRAPRTTATALAAVRSGYGLAR